MKNILKALYNNEHLSREEAKRVLLNISEDKYRTEEISSFLTVYNMRNITVDELTGFRDCLHEKCVHVNLSEFDPIDLCGTGGDGKNTFNISTLASFVVAGAGYKVAKHGNYGVSSISGSSNVLQKLGLRFTNDIDKLKFQLDRCNITFLHAPLFHPALKIVAPIRKKLGVRTFFNMLGPMVNPAFPRKQIVGVFSLELQRYYKYIYENEDKLFQIIHALDGYDEISLTGETKIVEKQKTYILSYADLVEERVNPESIFGGNTLEHASKIFIDILQNNGTLSQNNVVCANAAMAINCLNPEKSIQACFEEAQISLRNGKAFKTFKQLLAS